MIAALPTIVILCKRPKLHQGKQRLVEGTSSENALTIAESLLACAVEDANNWQGNVVVACSSENDIEWVKSLFENAYVMSQIPPGSSDRAFNLGERLNFVDTQLRTLGHQQLLMIGTDAPILNKSHFNDALATLKTSDIALSKADDGGVVIMANRVSWPDMTNLPWSTDALSISLAELCQQQQLSVEYTLSGYDIDYVADLKKVFVDLQKDNRPARKALVKLIGELFQFSGETSHA